MVYYRRLDYAKRFWTKYVCEEAMEIGSWWKKKEAFVIICQLMTLVLLVRYQNNQNYKSKKNTGSVIDRVFWLKMFE